MMFGDTIHVSTRLVVRGAVMYCAMLTCSTEVAAHVSNKYTAKVRQIVGSVGILRFIDNK